MHRPYPNSLLQIVIFLSATLGSFAAQADYVQTNLVSDISGFATITGSKLEKSVGNVVQSPQVHSGFRIRELTYQPSIRSAVEP